MASFSIDDVRDTLRADITRILQRIEEGSRLLATLKEPPVGEDTSSFRGIGDGAHAIYGSCALVGAESLATSARSLEKLAERGEEEATRAREAVLSAKRFGKAAKYAVQQMREMLELELSSRGDEAQWAALEWQALVEQVLNGGSAPDATSTPPAASEATSAEVSVSKERAVEIVDAPAPRAPAPASKEPEETELALFDEGDDGSAPAEAAPHGNAGTELDFEEAPAPAGDDDVRRELLAVFDQEARGCLVALQGYFSSLSVDPTNATPVAAIERLFHTLKGAAATLGLDSIRDGASALQHRTESMIESGKGVDRDALDDLVAETNRMLATANLPGITLDSGHAEAAPNPGARGDFEREARGLMVELGDLVDALGAAPEGARGELQDRIGGALHRLRGSALVVGEEQVAEVAGALESACADGTVKIPALTQGVAKLAAALRLPPRSASPESEMALLDARGVFFEEARQIQGEAWAILAELDASAGSLGVGGSRERLAALLHRLKGSAAIVAHDAIAGEAAQLHDLLEEGELDPKVAAVREALARIGAHIPARAPSSIVSGGHEPVALVREAVTLPQEPELWRAFTLECTELLDGLERETLDLEQSDSPKDHVRALLRHYHTLKGVVNTMGLTPTGAVIHRMEDFLEELLNRPKLPKMRAVVSLLLQVQVEVRKNLRQAENGYVETSLSSLEGRATRLLKNTDEDSSLLGSSELSERSEGTDAPSHRSAADGADRKFTKVATERLDVLMDLAGELVVSRSRLLSKVTDLRVLQNELGRGSKRLIETVEAFRRDNEFANLDGRQVRSPMVTKEIPEIIRKTDDTAKPAEWGGFTDLELDRYDDVHVLSRRLAEITSDFQELYAHFQRGVSTLTDDSDAFGGIISGIQNEVTRARMVPLEFLFARLRLPVRDAAVRDSKQVRVVTRGESVHLDKTIADALFQPMLHLVRNSVSHGIERDRERRGKGSVGTITLAARQESGQVVLEVKDDGGGLDLEALRARGVEMGLIPASTQVTDPAVKELVFAPQLSTQKDRGAVAGRGVGCDVVRRAVERLNGTIRVDSERGRGTTFTVTLPLTLAITKALLVKSRDQLFAVPLYFAERIIDAQEQRVVVSAGHRRVKVDGAFVPVRTLGEVLAGAEAATDDGPVLMLRVGDQRLALQVDTIVAHEEIVVKNLGALLGGHPLFAGVSIRGTGELMLILDVPELVEVRGSAARHAREGAASGAAESTGGSGATPSLAEATPHVRRTKLRVLFVDDSLSVRKVAELNLKSLGVDVTLAVDGIDALNKLREQTFDVVFTDLEMPRMHGYELIRELRFLPAYADLPILVVTSRSGQKHQDQARALGATDYMSKPFTAQSLEAALKKFGKIRSDRGSGSEGGGA